MKLKTILKQFYLIITLLLLFLSTIQGQTPVDKYQTESIYLNGSNYVKNGVEHRIVSWNGDLKKEMEISPDAVMEYSKFQRTRKAAFVLRTMGIVTIASSLFVDNNDTLKSGLLLGGFGLMIVAVPIYSSANNKLHKAIWLRNGAILN